MNKYTKIVLLGSCIAIGLGSAATAVSHSITKKLASFAMARPTPKISKKTTPSVGGTPQQPEISQLRQAAADSLCKKKHELIELVAKDGEHLVGHWFCQEGAKRTIIAMHGWRSSWADDFGLITDFWLNNGCNILFPEQRGQHNSGGEYIGFGLLERYDCVDWANWVQTRCNLPIYLSGISMGATTVLMASSLPLPENVRGIMADCGFTSPHDIWKHVAKDNLHISYNKARRKAIDTICKQNLNGESAYYSCADALRNCTVPVLFFHGSDDEFVPVDMTYKNYKACASEKRLMIVPGAGHGQSYLLEQEKYESIERQFWSDFD